MALFLLLFMALLAPAAALMSFINPPPFGGVRDFKDNPAYALGSVVEVAWTEGDAEIPTSLTLWQLDPVTSLFYGKQEYITRNAVNISAFTWIVATTKDLAESNLFYFSIFKEGEKNADGNSHYFNILSGTKSQPSPSSSAVSSTSPTPTPDDNAGPTSSPVPSPSTTPGPSTPDPRPSEAAGTGTGTDPAETAASHSGGLDTGIKIAIGVSAGCAVILGVVAVWLVCSRRRRKRRRREAEQQARVPPYGDYGQWEMMQGWRPGAAPTTTSHGGYVPEWGLANKQDYPVEVCATDTQPQKLFELPGSSHR